VVGAVVENKPYTTNGVTAERTLLECLVVALHKASQPKASI